MRPPLYMRSVLDRNVVMRRIYVCIIFRKQLALEVPMLRAAVFPSQLTHTVTTRHVSKIPVVLRTDLTHVSY
jgi:hypothetical protein